MSLLAWTDQLPDNWDTKPLRSAANYVVSNVDKVSNDGEIPVRLCNYKDVYNNEFITPALDLMQATASEAEIAKFGVVVDDVIITKDSESWDDIGVPALVRETAGDLVCGYHLALLRPLKQKMDGAFLFRCLQAKPVRMQLELAANGVTRFGIPKSEIGTMRLPVPPLAQQRTIADYLDRETERLDTLIVTKERSIALLKERRAVLIAKAVTGQIDVMQVAGEDHAPATRGDRRSAVADQLAPIFPDGWGTTQLRYASICLDGCRIPLNIEQRSRRQGEYPYWGANGVVDSIDEYLFNEPLVLIGEDGAPFFDSTRQVAFFVTGKIWVNNHIHVLRIGRNFDPRFVTYCLNATDYGPHIEGSTRDKLTQEKMGNIRLPSPPLPQQRAIADFLDQKTARLDALSFTTERTIELLKERRAALIATAVTGRIELEGAS